MCQVSDQLKLCSCKTKNVEDLKHYWILKRYHDESEWKDIVGQTILPANIGEDAHKLNINTIRKTLNSGKCFDVALQHQENDILELHFTCNAETEKDSMYSGHGNYLAYAFVFKNNKWKKTDYDPFGANLAEVQKGKIVRPFRALR
jgi:hypothetical protein